MVRSEKKCAEYAWVKMDFIYLYDLLSRFLQKGTVLSPNAKSVLFLPIIASAGIRKPSDTGTNLC